MLAGNTSRPKLNLDVVSLSLIMWLAVSTQQIVGESNCNDATLQGYLPNGNCVEVSFVSETTTTYQSCSNVTAPPAFDVPLPMILQLNTCPSTRTTHPTTDKPTTADRSTTVPTTTADHATSVSTTTADLSTSKVPTTAESNKGSEPTIMKFPTTLMTTPLHEPTTTVKPEVSPRTISNPTLTPAIKPTTKSSMTTELSTTTTTTADEFVPLYVAIPLIGVVILTIVVSFGKFIPRKTNSSVPRQLYQTRPGLSGNFPSRWESNVTDLLRITHSRSTPWAQVNASNFEELGGFNATLNGNASNLLWRNNNFTY